MLRTREEAREEALYRMGDILKMHENTLADFKKGVINKTEPGGGLFWLTDEEKSVVKDIENDYPVLAYHWITTKAPFEIPVAIMYVSLEDDNWEGEREMLRDNCSKAFVSYTIKGKTEYADGEIGIKPFMGAVLREW